MRFTSAILALSSLALLASKASAALTPQEHAAYELKYGSGANFCTACIEKALHNHFPHACPADLDSQEANYRPSGPTEVEQRCICVAFQDLYWKKADCSKECPYVFNEGTMKFFLNSDKIPGCDKWIDFEAGEEKVIEGFSIKNPDHKPELFELAEAPEIDPTDEDPDRGYTFSVSVTLDEEKEKARLAALELEGNAEAEVKVESEEKKVVPEEKKPETETKKDEL
ncbi:hypothetical protein BGZ76_009460 [Entomortierella beljakovae]|nr:hypothetical protein BGZ76_009460 [Entomortierella beljakovae]